MTDQVERLEAQVNALAQAWLHLAAAVEMAGVVEHTSLTHALDQLHWPDEATDHVARQTLDWLVVQLNGARQSRLSRGLQH